jgi:hypothetical protein
MRMVDLGAVCFSHCCTTVSLITEFHLQDPYIYFHCYKYLPLDCVLIQCRLLHILTLSLRCKWSIRLVLPTKPLYSFIISSMYASYPAHHVWYSHLNSIRQTKICKILHYAVFSILLFFLSNTWFLLPCMNFGDKDIYFLMSVFYIFLWVYFLHV